MDKELTEIFVLLESIERIEIYTQNHSDPDSFFAANYQKDFNDKIDLLVSIGKELEKKDRAFKKELVRNLEEDRI